MTFILMIKFYNIKTHTYTDPALSTQPTCGKVSEVSVAFFFFFVPVTVLIMYLYCF